MPAIPSFRATMVAFHASFVMLLCQSDAAYAESGYQSVQVVREMLSNSGNQQSYEQSKFNLDRIIDPTLNEAAVKSELDRLTSAAQQLSAGGNDVDKLKAARQVIYDEGVWNGDRPFAYDHADPYGLNLRNKLLVTYIATRLGNCVSMPILQLIVAERLGLNVSLSTAPAHVFVRYTNPANGRSLAIEATSGGNPTREVWYHEQLGVTDAQVESGIYLGTLTKRESIAVMASTVSEWLMQQGRYEEAVELSNLLLEYFPKDVHALLTRGTAQGQILEQEFVAKYPTPASIPLALQPRYRQLASGNTEAFRQAEAWGWTPPPTRQ